MAGAKYIRPALFGVGAAALLLVVYVVVVTAVTGWAFMLSQFVSFWYFIVALAVGFGAQIALYVCLRDVARHRDAGKVVAVSGGTSTAAMISCCAHYLTNVAPVLGATGLIAFVAQYQTELFWAGLVFNLAGIAYVGRKLWLASRHMAQMALHA
jgi:Cu+-exporting ATPase